MLNVLPTIRKKSPQESLFYPPMITPEGITAPAGIRAWREVEIATSKGSGNQGSVCFLSSCTMEPPRAVSIPATCQMCSTDVQSHLSHLEHKEDRESKLSNCPKGNFLVTLVPCRDGSGNRGHIRITDHFNLEKDWHWEGGASSKPAETHFIVNSARMSTSLRTHALGQTADTAELNKLVPAHTSFITEPFFSGHTHKYPSVQVSGAQV